MMADLTTTGILVTATVALSRAVEWLAKSLMSKGRDVENGHSGQKSVTFWEQKIERIVEEAIGKSFRGRNEQIRQVFLEANEPLYEKLDRMLQNQDAVLAKLNDLYIEFVRQRARD